MTNVEFDKAMGLAIREQRKLHGMTQRAVGDALGVTFQQIQKYERGTNGLAARYIPLLAAFFGIGVSDLYEKAGLSIPLTQPTEADHQSFLAARYVKRISNAKTRGILVDMARKFAYEGAKA